MGRRSTGISLVVVAIAAVATGVFSSRDQAEATHGCRPAERDVVARTAEAAVFRKGTYRSGRRGKPFYYACHLTTGSTFRLNGRDDIGFQDVDRATIELSGRFVAFVTLVNSAGPLAPVAGLRVMDLRSGELRGSHTHDSPIGAVVVRRDGAATATVASSSARGATFPARVVQVDARGQGRVLDSGEITLRSLALSSDRTTVYWTSGGRPRSAPSG